MRQVERARELRARCRRARPATGGRRGTRLRPRDGLLAAARGGGRRRRRRLGGALMAAGRQDGRRAGRPVGRLGGRGCATAGPCAPAGGVQRGTGVVGAEGGSGRGVTSKERELGRSLSSYVGAGGEGAGVNDKRSARRCRWVLQGVRSGDRPRRLDTQPTGGGCTDSLNTEPQRGVIPPGKERWAGRGGGIVNALHGEDPREPLLRAWD